MAIYFSKKVCEIILEKNDGFCSRLDRSVTGVYMERIYKEISSSKNRAPSHSPFGAYETETQALIGDRKASANTLDLNGIWDITVYENPESVPDDWMNEDGNATSRIKVPSCLEFEGIG